MISHHVHPVEILESTSMTWKTVPKLTLPTITTFITALSSMEFWSMNFKSLAWFDRGVERDDQVRG